MNGNGEKVVEKRTCVDCKQEFDFTEREAQFFAQMDFQPPKRCPACRKIKKAKNQEREKQAQ